MATRLPSALPRRPTTALPFSPLTHTSNAYQAPSHTPLSHTPSRAATLIKRPKRPYSFTQLVQLSDGSTYTIRTSSPMGMYKSTKDTRNHALWNPNEKSLQNVEVDEAGKLAAFRGRFGRGWDVAAPVEETTAAAAEKKGKERKEGTPAAAAAAADAAGSAASDSGSGDALADLIAGYATGMKELPMSSGPKKTKKK
ncbi:hypothetical protein FHL15_002829 [Xylaria flabelliformis]|uniref:Ribosomal protein bL31m N-terminal domain-containing protein n=1 Tax=Xylaria flabelliformis TaxID=2512241 RepID=A0A553I7C5_9PEZI|nr:hypothetical protein FHL15_002829 [Xylaria flabelliformis]